MKKTFDPTYKGYIPFVGSWYSEPIPVSFIDSYILIWTNKYKVKKFAKEKIAVLNKKLKLLDDAHKKLEELFGFNFIVVD